MSAPDTNPYQSKLFNFINRQVRRWGDRLGTAGRHLRFSIAWGAQAALYPFYLFFQAGRKAGHQFHQTGGQPAQSLGHAENANGSIEKIASDLPIQEVLREEIVNIDIEDTSMTIRGVASLVESQTLVLVASDNHLLNVLTQEQQNALQQSIQRKLSTYALHLSPTHQQPLTPASLPARWLGNVIRWVQQSPVAITANLFGESQITTTQEPKNRLLSLGITAPKPVIHALDRNLADLESIPISTVNRLWQQLQQRLFKKSQITDCSDQSKQISPEHFPLKDRQNPLQSKQSLSLQELIQAAVDYFFGMRAQSPEVAGKQSKPRPPLMQGEQRIKALWGDAKMQLQQIKQGVPFLSGQHPLFLNASEVTEAPSKPSAASLSTEVNPFTIRALLWAAIDYFFGTKFTHQAIAGASFDASNHLGQSRKFSAIHDNQKNPDALGGSNSAIADPWLTWEDVFVSASTTRVITHPSHQPRTDNTALPSEQHSSSHQNRSAWESLRNRLQQLKAVRSLRRRSQHNDNKTNPQKRDLSNQDSMNQVVSSPTVWDSRDPLETAFDWVEADVTAHGYIKHPLEKILEWLDSLILWLEQLWEKLWARLV